VSCFRWTPHALRDERRRDHLARIAPLGERPVQDVARAACLIARAQLAVTRHAVEPPLQLGQVVRQPVQACRRLRARAETAMVMESLCTSIPR
jgi:hypothetical protein